MSKIKIKNFGPIKEGYQENDGWLDVKKVTVLIGNQGSGKSTVAKLISTFTWIEKALVRGDYDAIWFSKNNRFKNQYLAYHRISSYLEFGGTLFDTTEIDYNGDAYHIKYNKEGLSIREVKKAHYPLPQIMYVPAERNFIANIKTPKELRLTSDALKEFLTEFDKAKNAIKEPIRLPINNADIEYDKSNDVVNIKGLDYKLRLTEASSGFQSLVPLYLVSWFLANSVKQQSEITKESMSSDELERFRKGVADIWSNENLTEEQRRIALSVLSSKFNKMSFINIVEEPEQNLYPTSQWEMLKCLLEFNNLNKGNKLLMTTHSPYIFNYLSIAIQAGFLKNKTKSDILLNKLYNIVPIDSIIQSSDVAIYQLDEKDGIITRIPDYEGIPSDNNYLNKSLAEGNRLFDLLLEIEEEL